MIEDDLKRKKSKEAEKAKEKEIKHMRKSPKPNRRSLDAEKITKHPSPKHEPKKITAHGKKGFSKTNLKEDVPK